MLDLSNNKMWTVLKAKENIVMFTVMNPLQSS